jgi:hypothetical protein
MERIVKVILIFASLFGVSYLSFHKNPRTALQASDLALENVEALADGESVNYNNCFGSGSIDCDGIKAEMKFTGLGIGF